MTTLKKPIAIETTFDVYTLTEQIGEGGAGRVFGGIDSGGQPVAVKVLTAVSADKRKRFKNETAFLLKNTHANIATVVDHGIGNSDPVKGPFYVMPRYGSNLRTRMKQGIAPKEVMPLFAQILDGVEAAHMMGVTHRDLKPENILLTNDGKRSVVADFGVASFTADLLHTLVDTKPTTKLANFQYAAPEQRSPGQRVSQSADIYALGLMLNELFTGIVPQGTDYKTIRPVTEEFGFLDPVIAQMINQDPAARPQSIADVKGHIQKHHFDMVTRQKLSTLQKVVIPAGKVDDPLAFEPPKLIAAHWAEGTLHLTLDRPVNQRWVGALQTMGNYSSVMGIPPSAFRFDGANVTVNVRDTDAQNLINFFKEWLPKATTRLHHMLEQEALARKQELQRQLKVQLEAEQRSLAINRTLKI